MKKVKVWGSVGLVGCTKTDFIKVDDDATEEEIQDMAREYVFENFFDWGFEVLEEKNDG